MEEGVFIFLDCLGFKGIWNRSDPKLVLDKLTKIEDSIEKDFSPISLGFPSVEQRRIVQEIALLSDSVAVSVKFTKDSDSEYVNAPELVGRACSYVIAINRYFIENTPHLALRGCITYGEHLTARRFIIGPAVDRAVELEKLPNGAFIWLEPAVSNHYKSYVENWTNRIETEISRVSDLEQTDENKKTLAALRGHEMTGFPPYVVAEYDMPIKGGERIQCSVINPLKVGSGVYDSEKILTAYGDSMVSDRIDVILKRQHTLKFLKLCYDLRNRYDSDLVTNLGEYHRLVA